MATFLSTLFGCGSQKAKIDKAESIYPIEDFSVIQATMANGKPVIGSINLAYKDYDKKQNIPGAYKLQLHSTLTVYTETVCRKIMNQKLQPS